LKLQWVKLAKRSLQYWLVIEQPKDAFDLVMQIKAPTFFREGRFPAI
jgi:hypothetical protein